MRLKASERITNYEQENEKGISVALICALMTTTTAASLNVCSYADNTSVSTTASTSYKVKSRKVNLYAYEPQFKKTTSLYFVNDTDIPYMDLSDLIKFMSGTMVDFGFRNYNIDMKADLSRESDDCRNSV